MAAGQASQEPIEFAIQKIFTESISFESPGAPLIFKEQWQPEANVDINSGSELVGTDEYKVSLTLTVTVKIANKTAFLVEAKQTGIFTIKGVSAEQLGHILGAFCPGTLFPYAKEAIASSVGKGGFPPLSLAPVNFDMIYQQGLAKQEVKH